jgi:hypothetical protein
MILDKWHGVSTIHVKGLHGKETSSSWLYSGVVHAIVGRLLFLLSLSFPLSLLVIASLRV